jgi:formate hydrogenlyase subunit 4
LVSGRVSESGPQASDLSESMSLVTTILGVLANVVAVLLLAPFMEGVLRKVTARIQSRQGPPLWQPYYDLLKLLGKEDLESGESPRMQRFAVHLSLATVLTVACLVPLGFPAPLQGTGDAILVIYLLTLAGISTLLTGLAAGSTFSLLGISREMMTMIALEPLFAVAVVIGVLHTRSFSLASVLDGSMYATTIPVSGLLMFVVMLLSFQAFVQRVPFDIAEAETELMEGPLMEYSGPKLALAKYAQMVKLVIYSALFVGLFVPWGSDLGFPVGWLLFWAKVMGLVLLVTLIAATHARYRIDQALRYFAVLLVVALAALVLTGFGY